MQYYIGLGSNIGDREGNLLSALIEVHLLDRTRILAVSSLYETDPVGYEDQPSFLNAVVSVESELEPLVLLDKLQYIELILGRERAIRWGPRTIDLDILFCDKVTIKTEKLMIPHPRALERSFVMVPLAEIAPEFRLSPVAKGCSGVKLYKSSWIQDCPLGR